MKHILEYNDAIRNMYQVHGVEGFYKKFGQEYHNPHESKIVKSLYDIIDNWNLDLSNVLDLAAGGGEVTKCLIEKGYNNVEGIDPYTCELYTNTTEKPCYKDTFESIANNGFKKKYSTIFCSFALHLIEPSYLNNLLFQIAYSSEDFVILSPTKKPNIKNSVLELQESKKMNGIWARWYKSPTL